MKIISGSKQLCTRYLGQGSMVVSLFKNKAYFAYFAIPFKLNEYFFTMLTFQDISNSQQIVTVYWRCVNRSYDVPFSKFGC